MNAYDVYAAEMKKLGRIPLPPRKGGPQGSKKGKKGYNRKEKHKQ